MANLHKLLTIIIVFPIVIFAQSPELKFEHITVDQGLSNNTVHGMSIDSRGFLWICTADGLNKYDGYLFTIYRNDPADSSSLSHNYLWGASQYNYKGKKLLGIITNGGGYNTFNLETEQFTRYQHDPHDSWSLTKKWISTIHEDSLVRIRVEADNSSNKLDPKTRKYSRYLHDSVDLKEKYDFGTVIEDTTDVCWFVNGKGLGTLDQKTGYVTYYKPYRRDKMPQVMETYISNHHGRKVLWLGSFDGLYKFDYETEQFTQYKHDPDNPNSISDNEIYSIHPYKINRKDVLLIGTANGLNLFDPDTERFTRYYHDPADPTSLSDNFIVTMLEDNSGVIWIATHGGGLNKLNPHYKQFNIYRHNPADANSLSDNSVWSIAESEHFGKDVLWIGTKNGGLNKLNRKTGMVNHFRHHSDNSNSLSNNWVFKTLESKFAGKDELWIGTYDGLNKLDLKTEKFTHYKHEPEIHQSTLFFGTRSLFESLNGEREFLWIGAEGLNKFHRLTGRFTQFDSTLITTLYGDKLGFLWFGGQEFGLSKFIYKSEQFTSYRHDPDDPNSISSNRITSIYESSRSRSNVLWIGTDKGLNKLDRESEQFIHFGINDGLPNETINGILEDKHGKLWLSTNYGLSKFDPKTNTFRNYDVNDGLQGNQFNQGACYQSEDGEMFFGGINGLNYFYPDSIRDNPHIPPVVITEFRIFNQPVKIKRDNKQDSDNIYSIPKSILYTDEIELSYKESVFSFEFAALDYISPEDNQYKYKMEGVDPDWVLTDASRRFATYTQLDPGEYTFQVRGSNNDGLWNNGGTSIRIIITPPWWRKTWAYTVYILLFTLTLYALRTYDKKRQRLRHDLEFEHLHTEKLQEVDHLKSRFFANISHEFRTPLTLIEGPVKQMLSGEFTGNMKEQYKMILRNSGRLLRLINQLLDLSKLESGKLRLQARATDIITLTNQLVQAFESLAVRKQITLKFESELDFQEVFIDVDKYEKIINNLLSNAFKFTPEQGTIEVDICRGMAPNKTGYSTRHAHGNVVPAPNAIPAKAGIQREDDRKKSRIKKWIPDQVRNDKNSQFPIPNSDFVEITVSNTGRGIPADHMNKIFDRFYQVDGSYTMDGEGTGIGLALTKELVELHHGIIDVQSNKGTVHRGATIEDLFCTTFTVSLPLGKGHLTMDDIFDDELDVGAFRETPLQDALTTPSHIEERETITESGVPSILIVEDNADLRQYIRSSMQNDYTIIEAENGEKGLKKAKEEIPDLIISDVMMPKMDGFEFCSEIKANECTSHIPVILITARAEQEDKIEGLETGADDYITKPFDNKELTIRVSNLIEQRRLLRKKFGQSGLLDPNDVAVTSNDTIFLERAMELINKNMTDSEFSVEQFAYNIGLSRMQLHRKLKALTDYSTSEFIRVVRLHRAATLLKHKKSTVSEIAFEVGFNNLSYFARSFRKHFGKSPSSYSANQN